MADLENNINPTTDNAENINSDIAQNNELNANLWEINQVEQAPVYESSQIDTINGNQPESTLIETPNSEIILWKFDNAMINTVQEQEVAPQQNANSLEQPTVQETFINKETNTEDSQKSKTAQKEKLLQLIKVHESKARTKGFTTWIISGVVLSVWILALSCIFAKDQIINLLNWENGNSSLSANVVELNINTLENENSEESENVLTENDDESDNEDIYDNEDYEDVNEEFDEPLYYEDLNEDYEESENVLTENDDESDNEDIYDNEDYEDVNEEFDEPLYYEDLNEDYEESENVLTENDDEIINQNNETIPNEEMPTTEYNKTNDDKTDISEYDSSSNEKPSKYSITHVNSTWEANWVLPSHCTDLTCYGEDKKFSPCTTFKLSENLDENANRIGNTWVCRYKDASELVYVELK